NDFNARIIEQFRANGGRVGEPFEKTPLLLLHHTGARTGTERVNPVAYLADGSRYVIIASKAGAPTNPDWYHNLRAHPDVTIEIGTDTLKAMAHEVTGDERQRLFSAMAERNPNFAEYQRKTDRLIPVIVLDPVS
ncbi:MAG: nitroreductase family deazaflavin-dependent oxidoreductase, partial [Solirubrobacterales bacterium]|nr:nitroreductase family deazaflavin-dependent oxidoreductase [Solirubrobacterales bacterium]